MSACYILFPSSKLLLRDKTIAGRYVDVILQLIEKAGDFVSDDIWYRVVQFVTNNEDLQVPLLCLYWAFWYYRKMTRLVRLSPHQNIPYNRTKHLQSFWDTWKSVWGCSVCGTRFEQMCVVACFSFMMQLMKWVLGQSWSSWVTVMVIEKRKNSKLCKCFRRMQLPKPEIIWINRLSMKQWSRYALKTRSQIKKAFIWSSVIEQKLKLMRNAVDLSRQIFRFAFST